VVEGARLESVCRGNSTVGSNPTLSANLRQTLAAAVGRLQLVAGYSKTLPNRGLKAFMPDYNDLSKTGTGAGPRSTSAPRAGRGSGQSR
jgi:hypothetical protein